MSSPQDYTNVLSSFNAGVRLSVKAKPGSSRARAPKIVDICDDKCALEIAVAAAPEDGKANKAIIATLAKALSIPKADINIKSGTTARLKIIEISGDPQSLYALVRAWLDAL